MAEAQLPKQQTVQSCIHTYYGPINENEPPPKNGVHVFMVNEFITAHMNKEKERFTEELKKIITNFNLSQKELITSIVKQHEYLEELIKQIIKINKLILPEIKNKKIKVDLLNE